MMEGHGAANHTLEIGGIWWRASRYQIQDGLIGPVPGSPIDHYDPWAAHADARAGWGGGGSRPPYAALLELVWQIRLLPPRARDKARLTPESEALIVGWCTAHGLLGVLLHETEAVYYAARWGNAKLNEDGQREGVLQPIRTSYTWSASAWEIAGWSERLEPWSVPSDPLHRASFDNEDGIYEGALVQPELISDRWRPEVLVHRAADGGYATLPLGAAWGPFFPGVAVGERSTYRYPWPGSERWWGVYAEPLERFLEAAGLLYEALTQLNADSGHDNEWGVRHFGLPTRGQILLHELLQGARPMLFRAPDGNWTGGWRTKSLLASFAMMAYLDLVHGKRILTCDVCGKPYVSSAYQARYCSDRCRNTALKRAYRSRTHQRSHAGVPPTTAE
jgi:hypothetical protein